ncbi:unnamed protein product [Arctia plantaginis]|uniref:Uncharacterized protein n=1 Tax=Arctia plantaginis TaxID=874455 RepID=A0A8S1ALL0_ARCPL|nr:unnamed protein product [Arctia plantaginis]
MQLAKVVSCDLKEADIHHCTRVAKSNRDGKRPRTIIVKLATSLLRDTFLAKAIQFDKANLNDKINTNHIGTGGTKMPIYVLKHLSPTTRNCMQQPDEWRKTKDLNLYGLNKVEFSCERQKRVNLFTLKIKKL